MNFFLLALLNLTILVSLLVFSFYRYIVGLSWDEHERHWIEQAELNLAHLLTLLEQPDTKWILEQTAEGRRFLFLEYSTEIREDIVRVFQNRRLNLALLLLSGAFFASYYLLRFKARVSCARSDLRYLCGLSLVMLRQAELKDS